MTDREQLAFDMYFGNIVGIQMHPANNKGLGDIDYQELEQYAMLALRMLEVRNKLCHSSKG